MSQAWPSIPSASPIKKTEALKEQGALPSLKRSGFALIIAGDIAFAVASKTKRHCFFDERRTCDKAHSGIDKHFCILLMLQKFDARRHRGKK